MENKHVHWVTMPFGAKITLLCDLEEHECVFGKASPEEIGIWVDLTHNGSFDYKLSDFAEWLSKHRATETGQNSKQDTTVPVVQYVDGQRQELGRAFVEIEEKNGEIYTKVTIDGSSIKLQDMLRLPQTGFFSVGNVPPTKPFPSTDVFFKAVMDTEQREQLQRLGDQIIDRFLKSGMPLDEIKRRYLPEHD